MGEDRILGTIVLAAFVLLGNVFRKGGWLERWRNRGASTRSPQPPPISAPRGGGNPASADAQMRRLLEALGRPTTDIPPPAVPAAPKNRPPVLTARPPSRADVLPTMQRQKSKKQQKREREQERRAAPAPPPRLPPPLPAAIPAALATARRAAREITAAPTLLSTPLITQQPVSRGSRAAALRQRFSRKDSAREAVLLAEILGPPLALRLPGADAQFS